MTQPERSKPVVVGIDGSQAAIDAATWAVDEAVSLGVSPSPRTRQPRQASAAARRLRTVHGTSNAPNQLYTGQR